MNPEQYDRHIASLMATLADMIGNMNDQNQRIVSEMLLATMDQESRSPSMEEVRRDRERKMRDAASRYFPTPPPPEYTPAEYATEYKFYKSPPPISRPKDGYIWVDSDDVGEALVSDTSGYVMNETIRNALGAQIESKLAEQLGVYKRMNGYDPKYDR